MRNYYTKTLGLDSLDPMVDARVRKALDRAYQQRSFEIEHYWKRATFFWAFEAAILGAFGLVWRADDHGRYLQDSYPILLALAALGFLTALAGWLSAHGSKFWQENWENHIDMLENRIEGRLHKTVWLDDKKVRSSVTKLNVRLGFYFVLSWVFIFAYVGWKYLGAPPMPWPHYVNVAILAILAAIGTLQLCAQRTDLRATFPNRDGDHGQPFEDNSKCTTIFKRPGKTRTFVLRKAPDEN